MVRARDSAGGASYQAFVALALLAGPLDSYAANAMLVATNVQMQAGMAMASALGGTALLVLACARGQRLPRLPEWGVLLLLLAPQWCGIAVGTLAGTVPWLRGIGEGSALLIGVAAPLWLGLVAALEIVQIEVPVACVAAAIAGLFAVLLVIPASSYSMRWTQAPMLAAEIALAVATALMWAIARRRLAGLPVAVLAGGYLLLSAVGNAGFAWLTERSSWQPLDWRMLIAPVASEAVLLAVSWCLWFWLLQKITLGAFGMRALAAWAATAMPFFATGGLGQWRVDLAFAISAAACAIALRARAADEQPTALGLSGP